MGYFRQLCIENQKQISKQNDFKYYEFDYKGRPNKAVYCNGRAMENVIAENELDSIKDGLNTLQAKYWENKLINKQKAKSMSMKENIQKVEKKFQTHSAMLFLIKGPNPFTSGKTGSLTNDTLIYDNKWKNYVYTLKVKLKAMDHAIN